jgi:hypothetical protein
MKNDAVRFFEFMLKYDELVRKYAYAQGNKMGSTIHACLYCEFGRHVQIKIHPFWDELWEMLAPEADVDSIKTALTTAVRESAGKDSCNPYGSRKFLATVAEHFLPAVVSTHH